MKVSVTPVVNNGYKSWMVCYKPPGGKRKRLFFPTKKDAETEQSRLCKQQIQEGAIWLGLSGDKRNLLISLLGESEREGIDLREAMAFFKANRSKLNPVNYELEESWKAFYAEKKAAHLSEKTLGAFRTVLGRFVIGREKAHLVTIGREDCLKWLQGSGWKPRTFNNYLTFLKMFFSWCVDAGRLDRSPVEKIKKIPGRQMPDIDKPPGILTVGQCRALLDAAMKIDRGLVPYIAVCLFAGVRPDREAGELTWADVGNGMLRIKGLHAKTRQRRDIPIHPTLAAWLKMGGDFPIEDKAQRFLAVRLESGIIKRTDDGKLVGWTPDCMRHTFASNYLALYGVEKTVAAMGHGNYDMLFKHYREIVPEAEAKKFWALLPPPDFQREKQKK